MIKAVIFDMDGVLVDSEPAGLEQLQDFMQSHDTTCSEEFLFSLVGSSYNYTCEECLKLMKNDWDLTTFITKYHQYTLDYPISYAKALNSNVHASIQKLRKHSLHTAVASSSLLSQIKRMLEECELDGYFDEIVSGEMFKESKPNPEIYLYTASALGVKPEECIAVEDSIYGITAAKRAGMKVLAYRDLHFHTNQSGADVILDDLMDIYNHIDA